MLSAQESEATEPEMRDAFFFFYSIPEGRKSGKGGGGEINEKFE